MIPPRLYRRRITLISAILGFVLLYQFLSIQPRFERSTTPSSPRHRYHDAPEPRPECPPQLQGLEDVLVVMKTGVTEALDKVPVHFQTSFRCVPNYVIFSDFEEDIAGVRIHDAFRNMDPEVQRTNSDFDMYTRIKRMGRQGLGSNDFQDEANSAIGKPNNPGWKLDKWKFLPMVQETLRYKSDAKWYVFMEADTYFFWPNLLAWLEHFDPTKPLYIGTETQIADVIFAHGGSGFVVSNPAMQMAANQYATRTSELNTYTDHHWAGDCVLGKVLADVGVGLYYSWPFLQNSNLGELDEFLTDLHRKPWCYPAIALHHLSNEDIQDLYRFEHHRWLSVRPFHLLPSPPFPLHTFQSNPSNNHQSGKTLLLHSEIFKEKIHPSLPPHRTNWDNLASDEKAHDIPFEDCEAICDSIPDCVQFALKSGRCFTGNRPRLGVSVRADDVQSGWMLGRIQKVVDEARVCKQPDFR